MNFIILKINPEEINHDLQNPELNTHVHCQMIFLIRNNLNISCLNILSI